MIRATGKSLGDFDALTPAEQKLLTDCKAGSIAIFGEGCPEQSTPYNQIRAAFLRFLILGGDDQVPIHENGVRIRGAFIIGALDLQNAVAPVSFETIQCVFAEAVNISNAQIKGSVHLSNSRLPAVRAVRSRIQGVLVGNQMEVDGMVLIAESDIHGGASFLKARIGAKDGNSIQANRVRMEGPLVLESVEVSGCIHLNSANIKGRVNCSHANLDTGGKPALRLTQAQIWADLDLSNTTIKDGAVIATGARVHGDLKLDNASLKVSSGPSLNLNRAQINGNAWFNGAFLSKGSLFCQNALISGTMSLNGAWLDGAGNEALNLSGSQIRQNLSISGNAAVLGKINLTNTQIDGQLNFSGTFDGCGAAAIYGSGTSVKQGLMLSNGFSCKGMVNFIGARIDSQVKMLGGRFDGQGGRAISFDSARINGSLVLSEATVIGEMWLVGARIASQLICQGTILDGNGGGALCADTAVFGLNVRFTDNFVSHGEVKMIGATFEADLLCQDAQFNKNVGRSITLSQSTIRGKVVMGIKADGAVICNDVAVEGEFRCRGAAFTGKAPASISMEGARIKGALVLEKLQISLKMASFAGAHAGRLLDDENTWDEHFVLNGFRYDTLASAAPLSLDFRRNWLEKQIAQLPDSKPDPSKATMPTPEFRPQPWWQLKTVLEEMGHFSEARSLGMALEKEKRVQGLIGQAPEIRCTVLRRGYSIISGLLHALYGGLTGYGYRPLRLLLWFASIWLLCAAVYWQAALSGIFAPSNPLVFQNPDYFECRPDRSSAWQQLNPDGAVPDNLIGEGNWYLCGTLREEYTGFSPLAYSLDVLMPLVDLQQEADWAPLIPTPKETWLAELFAGSAKHWVRLVIWAEILLGWGFSLLLVAIVSGLARKTE
ncbi:hypothetical protein [Pseudomonas entomophila]|uniref:hypothetical protein n=1 Tax=Pseudomonas entomophila TaxID=312306 RepID=UPI001F01D649|nr:hypothetical protein [Pseudomonas entomophila]MCG8291737.1 hypothetical protein [Pseudomonas entomophila]